MPEAMKRQTGGASLLQPKAGRLIAIFFQKHNFSTEERKPGKIDSWNRLIVANKIVSHVRWAGGQDPRLLHPGRVR